MEEETCVFLTHSLLVGRKPHFPNASILTVNSKYMIPTTKRVESTFLDGFIWEEFSHLKNAMHKSLLWRTEQDISLKFLPLSAVE